MEKQNRKEITEQKKFKIINIHKHKTLPTNQSILEFAVTKFLRKVLNS